MLFKLDKRLGVSENRRYDLPLNRSAGNTFLAVLIALMTFLAMLALCASFALAQITERWSSGLENQITIEIPASSQDKIVLTSNEISNLQKEVEVKLKDYPGIESFEALEKDDVQDLVSPWLGDNFALDEVPLPGLIAITVKKNTTVFLKKLERDLKDIDDSIRLDTHADWLDSLLSLIGSMQFMALIITLIVTVTGITAIAGAIRSRMAEHRPDVELLHLMGASDSYISRQFQRHALILGLQGGFAGLVFGSFILFIFSLSAGDNAGLLPAFSLSGFHIGVLIMLPLIACFLCAFTARFTVLRELARMP